jgi:hypothetical protein
MLLFRLLLVNDASDFACIHEHVNGVLGKFAIGGAPIVSDRLPALLREAGDVFAPSAVLYRREDRERSGSAIPESVWEELMHVGFKLVSNVPGYSVCGDRGDCSTDRSDEHVKHVIDDLVPLATRIHIELFQRPERDRELAAICHQLLAEHRSPK